MVSNRDIRNNKIEDILLQGKQLVATDEDLVTRLERSCDNAFLGLDGEVNLVDGTQDLIDLANWSL